MCRASHGVLQLSVLLSIAIELLLTQLLSKRFTLVAKSG